MKCYAQPYDGEKPYIFFSYCHKNEALDFPLIERLIMDGFRVWFDDGLHPGDEWPEVVAEHIAGCSVFIAAVSEESAKSHNCKKEITFAIDSNKPLTAIVLEKFPLSRGMQLQLSSSNYINYYDYISDSEAFYSKLESSSVLASCRGSSTNADAASISVWKSHISEYAAQEKVSKLEKTNKDYLNEVISTGINLSASEAGNDETGNNSSGDAMDNEGTVIENDNEGTIIDEDEEGTVIETDSEHELPFSLPDLDPEGTVRIVKNPPHVYALVYRCKTAELFSMITPEVSMGRDPHMADLTFTDQEKVIGRLHAFITASDGKFFLRDNGSTNGTVCHSAALSDEPVELRGVDAFYLGEEMFLFAGEQNKQELKDLVQLSPFAALTSLETYEIRLLSQNEYLLDRNHPWNDGVLKDRRISRESHAKIVFDGAFYLEDTGSANGTFLNGERLSKSSRHTLNNNDKIEIAHTPFLFHIFAAPQFDD